MRKRIAVLFIGLFLVGGIATRTLPTQKGIAMSLVVREDVDLLEADWWYYYGNNPNPADLLDPRYVPMLQLGDITANLLADYDGYVLVFNEPDLVGWAQFSPQEAYDQWIVLRDYYSNAQMVFGNISHLGMDWIVEFMQICGEDCPDLWGIHCYPYEEWQPCADFLTPVHGVIGTDMWLTETQATLEGNPTLLLDIIEWTDATEWANRFAVFGNRDMSGEPWWPPSWGDVALVEDDSLTALGRVFRDETFKIYLPSIIK